MSACHLAWPGAVRQLYSSDNVWWLFHYRPPWCQCGLAQSAEEPGEEAKGGCGRDNLAAHSETWRGRMCRGSCGIIYSISSPVGVKGGKKVARLEEINLPTRLSSVSSCRTHPLALCGDVFVAVLLEPVFSVFVCRRFVTAVKDVSKGFCRRNRLLLAQGLSHHPPQPLEAKW